jgi:3-oxoacyl-[acyl-carrier-protein] synthase-3
MGYYLPEHIVTSAALEEQLRLPSGWIERVAGVRERRYALTETASGMAAIACQRALTAASVDRGDIDLIVGASSGPQQLIPCTAALVQRALGAPDGRSACYDVGATCLSFLFALHQVAHLINAGVYRRALIFSSEVSFRSLNPEEPESAVLFGDSAVAAVVTAAPPSALSAIHHARLETHSSGADLTRLVGGGSLHHPNDPTTTPADNMFHMDGSGVFKKAVRLIGPFLDNFLAETGWRRAEIDRVVPHQASRHGVELLHARLGFRPDQVYSNLAIRGNCIAASIPLALAEAVADSAVRRGSRVLLIGTGAGLTIGAVALTY